MLLSLPMLWLGVAYLGALAVMLLSAFWGTDAFTGKVVHVYSTGNLHDVYTEPLYRTVALRTIGVALLVTRHRRDHRAADGAVHEQGRHAATSRRLLVVAVLDAAVGELPGQGVRVAQPARRRPARCSRLTGGHTPGYGLTGNRHHAGLSVAAVHGDPGLRRLRTGAATRCSRRAPTWVRARAARCDRSCCRMVFPGTRGRVDLHVLAVPRRLHRGAASSAARPRCWPTSSTASSSPPTTNRSPPRCRIDPAARDRALPAADPPHRRAGERLMGLSVRLRWIAAGAASWLGLAFLYVPLAARRAQRVQLRRGRSRSRRPGSR